MSEANTTCDGDKESDGEDLEADNGNSSEDLRKVMIVSFLIVKKNALRFIVHI